MMNRLCIKLIEFYKKKISPGISKRCKFYPTCSSYGIEAYKRFNFFKASFLTLWRLLRCNPYSKGGYDPVPEKKSKLNKITDTYYLLEYRENTDRPNLAYIYREEGSYIIDCGNSKKHLKYFYKQLKKNKLPKPKYSIITHHHWDHSFGLHYSDTISYGLKETQDNLNRHKEILSDKGVEELFNLKEIPLFCKDHIELEYKNKMNEMKIKLLDNVIDEILEIDDLLLIKIPSNYSNDNLVILDKKTHILFVGDALCGKIEGYDFIKDKNIIKEQIIFLEKLDFDVIIESHAFPTTKRGILNKLEKKYNELNEK